jgi:1-acyl-sn-glycerol-3-phosphate acyltransferase
MSLLSSVIRFGLRTAAWLFFEDVATEGDRVPNGPVLYLSNHPFHLVDVLIAGLVLDRPDVYFVAHSTIYEGLFVGWIYRRLPATHPLRIRLIHLEDRFRKWLFDELQLIPIHREKDGHGDHASQRENLLLLDRAASRIAEGHAVVIFPEGGSRPGYTLAPVKRGPALLAEKALAACHAAGRTLHVVCGSTVYGSYDEPFRSRINVRVEEIPTKGLSSASKRAARTKFASLIGITLERGLIRVPFDATALVSEAAEVLEPTNPLAGIARVSDAVNDPALRERIAVLIAKRRAIMQTRGLSGPEREGGKRLLLAPLALIGEAFHAAPSWILRSRVRTPPKKYHRRGYQVLGTAISVFISWYLVMLTTGIAAVIVGWLSLQALVVMLVWSVTTGLIYPHLYYPLRRMLIALTHPSECEALREVEAEIRSIIGSAYDAS